MAVSPAHEALIELFRQRLELAFEFVPGLRASHGLVTELPPNATEAAPVELRADLVLRAGEGPEALGVVIEVQLRPDPEKGFTWPAYLAALRHRHRHGFTLVVVTLSRSTARWARRPIETGHPGWALVPHVIGPEDVPVVDDAEQARADPELAVLSAMVHGKGPSAERVGRAAFMGIRDLDARRTRLYADILMTALGRLAEPILGELMQQGYVYQSDFAKRYVGEGVAEGLLLALRSSLTQRFPRSDFSTELDALATSTPDTLLEAQKVPWTAADPKGARAQLAALAQPSRS